MSLKGMVIGVTDDHFFLQASIIFTFRMQKNTIADLLILESYEWKYEVLSSQHCYSHY